MTLRSTGRCFIESKTKTIGVERRKRVLREQGSGFNIGP
jgi:hypothetical protein